MIFWTASGLLRNYKYIDVCNDVAYTIILAPKSRG
jgi:hypothetical protein